MGLTRNDVVILKRIANDRYGAAMPALLKIADKDRKLVDFRPTKAHQKLARNKRRFNYWVKPRQVWATSFGLADTYLDCTEGNGVKALFINLNARVSNDVFGRTKDFSKYFPIPQILPKVVSETASRIEWANGATFDAITVNNDGGADYARGIGRSCTVQRVHVTEAGYMRHYRDFMNGLEESLPRLPSCAAIIESTGNGAQGGFWEDCMEIYEKGTEVEPNVWELGDKVLCFIAWWEHDEYTLDIDVLPAFEPQFEPKHRKLWDESELEHRREMDKDASLSEEFKIRAIYWHRAKLLNKGFLKNPEEAIAIMDQEYPANLRHAFQSSGSAFFSLSITNDRFEEARKFNREKRLPIVCDLVSSRGDVQLVVGQGPCLLWESPYDPREEQWENLYCIGSDVGGGGPDSDPDVIWVKNRKTNRYVFVAHGIFGADEHARRLVDIARFYHDAMVAPEANNHGVGVQIKLFDSGYPNVYKFDAKADTYKGIGFYTNESTRNAALGKLKLAYEDRVRPIIVHYEEFYNEARTFRSPPGRTPTGQPKKPVADPGKHDDTITAMMICEALDSFMSPPMRIEAVTQYTPSQMGYFKQLAMNPPSGGLSNVI